MPQRKRKSELPPTPPPNLEPDDVMNRLNFDSMEDKIRGEESMLDSETRRLIETRDVKKKVDEIEVDRRLEELKKKMKKR